LQAPSIQTERLLLRPYRLDDFQHLLALYKTERAAFIGGKLSERQVWDGFMNCTGQWPVLGLGGWAVEESGSARHSTTRRRRRMAIPAWSTGICPGAGIRFPIR
jgi:RimJ/RimL family protein N-acetyltransferase